MNLLTQGYGYVLLDQRLSLAVTVLFRFMLSFDEKEKHDSDRAMVSGHGDAPITFFIGTLQTLKALFPDQETKAKYVTWYGAKTLELLKKKSFKCDAIPFVIF